MKKKNQKVWKSLSKEQLVHMLAWGIDPKTEKLLLQELNSYTTRGAKMPVFGRDYRHARKHWAMIASLQHKVADYGENAACSTMRYIEEMWGDCTKAELIFLLWKIATQPIEQCILRDVRDRAVLADTLCDECKHIHAKLTA